MSLFIFILVYPLIWLMSLLPLRVLFFFSDLLYIILYYIIGFRKKVVRYNLKLAFPEKSNKERLIIEKRSFHHFVDIFMEMIKSFSISDKEIARRAIFKNTGILKNFLKNDQSVIIMAAHYANWEWTVYLNKLVSCDSYAAYTKINNIYFENKMKESRNRYGANFILSSKFIDLMQEHVNNKHKAIYGFLSDQSPMLKKTHYWGDFMGVRVPIQTGAEMLAKRFDYPVVFLAIKRIKRGYYEYTVKILAEKPSEYDDYQITDMFTHELEEQIRNRPEFYFWTHKRFKHMSKEKESQK